MKNLNNIYYSNAKFKSLLMWLISRYLFNHELEVSVEDKSKIIWYYKQILNKTDSIYDLIPIFPFTKKWLLKIERELDTIPIPEFSETSIALGITQSNMRSYVSHLLIAYNTDHALIKDGIENTSIEAESIKQFKEANKDITDIIDRLRVLSNLLED